MKVYTSYEEGCNGTFTHEEMKIIYKEKVDKKEYTTFEDWLFDMLKSGVFEETTNKNFLDDEEKMHDFVRLTKEEFLLSYSYLTEKEYDNTLKLYNK